MSVRADLSDDQWDAVQRGELVAPDGRLYRRRSSRLKRKAAGAAVAAGAPMVLFWYGGGQLEWLDGPDASERWGRVRSAFTSDRPNPTGDTIWTGGVWVADDDASLILLEGTC